MYQVGYRSPRGKHKGEVVAWSSKVYEHRNDALHYVDKLLPSINPTEKIYVYKIGDESTGRSHRVEPQELFDKEAKIVYEGNGTKRERIRGPFG